MEEFKLVSTPMVTRCKFIKDNESSLIEQTLYTTLINSFLYVTASKLNIMHATKMIARFQVAPKETHVKVVKTIT